MRPFLCLTLLMALLPNTVHAADSFVYVAVLPCAAGPACTPEVDVYNATTAGLVTRILLSSGTTVSPPVISRDGRHVYVVENLPSGAGLLAEVDTSTNTVTAEYQLADTGAIATGRDPAQVMMLRDSRIDVFDGNTGALVRSTPFTFNPYDLAGFAASATDDRVFVSLDLIDGSLLLSIDSVTGAVSVIQDSTLNFANFGRGRVFTSYDGAHLYDTPWANLVRPSQPGLIQVWDLATNTRVFATPIVDSPTAGGVESYGTRRAYLWSRFGVGLYGVDTWDAIAGAPPSVPLPNTITQIVVSADDSRVWIETAPDPFDHTGINALTVTDALLSTVVTTIPMAGTASIVSTPPGAPTCDYRMNTLQSSWPLTGGTAALSLSTSCPWLASSNAAWARIDQTSGTGNATFTLTVDPNATTTSRSAMLTIGGQLVTVTQAGAVSTAPFGFIDTPADNLTDVTGVINVTGWALDDVGVSRVRIYSDPVTGEPAGSQIYIGDATFVDGARPDVQALYPTLPYASRAGWGLQVLTNVLPGRGNGTYRLSVYADDVEGLTTLLGTRTVTCANGTATLPFGTIDTPGPGQTVSGTIINFGWAITPQPNVIPFDGSTIDVLIDNVVVGHPTYGFARTDIDAAFPGYQNTGHAVGYFVIDTTQLANGIHTIAWVVHDNVGATAGIGSRFFTVWND